eukprot:5162408-Pleurochrysis_carterae.AAC.1
MQGESLIEGNAFAKIEDNLREEKVKVRKAENLVVVSISKTVMRMGMEEGERKQVGATAPAACARELLWRHLMRVQLAN